MGAGSLHFSQGDAENGASGRGFTTGTRDIEEVQIPTLANDKVGHPASAKSGSHGAFSPIRNDRGMGDMRKKNKSRWIAGCKERGEWAELWFMALARGMGFGVLKPFGESGRYDVAVEWGGRILRVQVKSTIYCRRGE